MASPRLLCVMGSGETAPTMVSVHSDLLARLSGSAEAVLLDTPFGFQENADDLVARTQEYFRHNVGHDIGVATFREAASASELQRETCNARLAAADYIFAGPGSPSYALRQWRESAIPDMLREKLRSGGCVTFASAAAVSLGVVALPVYEIYKVGEAPRWLDGINVLGELNLKVALVPHFNNAEGGGHDTRFCYMGERRLRLLEEMLPDGVAVLGVDEHTALVIDIDAQTFAVRGRGRVTVRRPGGDQISWGSGEEAALEVLRGATRGDVAGQKAPPAAPAMAETKQAESPFLEVLDQHRAGFDTGLACRDVDGMVAALLAVDTSLVDWRGDSLDSDERERGRALLRRGITGLGDVARQGTADPREAVAPFVEAMLALRRGARDEKRFADADLIRDALISSGVEIRDAAGGTEWSLRGA